MAAVFRSVTVPVNANEAWAVVGRFEDPVALAPGFATACDMAEGERVVSFADGGRVREVLVAREETRRRLSYAAVGGQSRHHHAVMEVVPIDDQSSRIEWVTEILPDSFVSFVIRRMDDGAAAIVRKFSEGDPGSDRREGRQA